MRNTSGISALELMIIVMIVIILALTAVHISQSRAGDILRSQARLIPVSDSSTQLLASDASAKTITIVAYANDWTFDNVDDIVDSARAAANDLEEFGVPKSQIVILFANGEGLDADLFPRFPKPVIDGVYFYVE